ncbi:ATP-binding cassette domain-containing protein [Blastomonas sp.]|uniref:ATP-binding cassette domain-containing protein n=1 Tax=Blastomonas sp. TaxID=1909299 RepID=UPI0035932E3D
MSTRSETIIETHQLVKSFGGVQATDKVDFALKEGELRCVIGPNGAGKSTFFKLLTGQIIPTSGKILFAGQDVTGLPSHKIARLGVGIKNQKPDVFDGLLVRENLWLAAQFAHDKAGAEHQVDKVIDRLQLGSLAHRLVGELAHGQRQWVEIGMVMAREPRLILLDEPSAGMSQDERVRTADLLKELNRTTTIVVVEHDMQFIKRIADIVTVFHRGAILREAHVDVVLKDPEVRNVYLGRTEVV